MSYYVYLLWSIHSNRTYAGHTENIEIRLYRHNSGFVHSTKAYRPWKLIYSEGYSTRAEAIQRELWLKTSTGRKWISEFLEKWKESGLSVMSSQSDDGRDHDPTQQDRTKPA